MQDAEYDKILGSLIYTVGNTNFPEALGQFVRQLVNFDNMIIIVYHKDHRPEELYREFNDPIVYKTMKTHYLKAAYLLDPFYHGVQKGIKAGIYRIFDLAPDQFKRTSYFNEYYRETTLIDEFAIFSNLSDDITLTICFGRDRSSGLKFTKKELKHVKSFEHTLSALLKQHWRDYDTQEADNIALQPINKRLISIMEEQHNISLTPRQAEVALYILQGHSSLSISLNLNISKETVKVFRKQLYSKCGISSQAELFSLFMPSYLSL